MKDYAGYIFTAIVSVLASWFTLKGTRSSSRAATETAYAQSMPEMIGKVQDLLEQLESKNGKIAELTSQVESQSHTIDALTQQVGQMQRQINKLTGGNEHE
ncbi:hypothetical protein [Levilactobacillus mulengensis]|uniref:hypothetical protein n=1 Tax=Levilactobacillus mulengensis TaxID=2486025 RepID=UPI000F7810AE|nr:hypothetical protein [Levilactobacillus mulengensis]